MEKNVGKYVRSATRVFDVVRQLATADKRIIDSFHVDAVDLNRTFHGPGGLQEAFKDQV